MTTSGSATATSATSMPGSGCFPSCCPASWRRSGAASAERRPGPDTTHRATRENHDKKEKRVDNKLGCGEVADGKAGDVAVGGHHRGDLGLADDVGDVVERLVA